MPLWKTRVLPAALLAAAAFLAYLPALRAGFTNFDDDVYVTANPRVTAGLSIAGVRWALATGHGANWHPATWISHELDATVWGLDPRGHHLTSMLFHAANASLLFLFFARFTGKTIESMATAALVALHPLNVESVAWVAQRKSVLCAFFWILTMIAWGRWAASPRPRRYVAAVALCGAALAAKPMAVTLPFALLLIDAWPLGRLHSLRDVRPRLVEKVPFFALAAASSVVTLLVQSRGEAVRSLARFPLADRLANAVVSWIAYAGRALAPIGLSPFYPHPEGTIAAWKIAAATAALAGTTAVAIRAWRRAPYLAFGWLWYLGTLVPVIGLVQVGEQGSADRYAYLPLVGLFVVAAWGLPDLTGRMASARTRRIAMVALAALVLPALAAGATLQASLWHDSIRLFRRALELDPRNATAHVNLALALAEAGDGKAAAEHYGRALEIRPDAPVAHNNLGLLLSREGRQADAIREYEAALVVDPRYAEAHGNLGIALAMLGRSDEAIARFESAARLAPGDPVPLYNWGLALAGARRFQEAIRRFEGVIAIEPTHGAAHSNLGAALLALGDLERARHEVDLARRYGFPPPPDLVRLLGETTPEPERP